MRTISSNYSVEVDTVTKDSWHQILSTFDDANIFQTWSYDEVRSGKGNTSHLILKKDDEIVAASQVRILRIPFLNTGIAYIRWGPLWRLHGTDSDPDMFTQILRALRNEYVHKRGYVLRILPLLFTEDADLFAPLFKQEGFIRLSSARRETTLILDIRPSLDDLRKGLYRKWRNHLNRAEKNNLEIIEGTEDELFDIFMSIFNEMLERKKFIDDGETRNFYLTQKKLPNNLKMKIFICKSDNKPCAGVVCTAMGRKAIYLLGATNNEGMKNKSSYLLQWRVLQWLKEIDCHWYDLHGINPEKNPGVYEFKSGLCHNNGKKVTFLGHFETYKNSVGLLFVKSGEKVRSFYRNLNERIHMLRFHS